MFTFHLHIHGRQVEAQLAQVLGLELVGFQLDDHIAAQFQMIEQQIDEKVVAAHFQWHLPPNECKSCA
ncbi:hypothetical protein D3C84_1256640 [compost metagenome]